MVCQWCLDRYRHDNQAINTMIDRAEGRRGKRPLKEDRFGKVTDAEPVVDWTLVERAHSQVSLNGYVTNISDEAAYHDLYQVERSFRMAKSGLAAGPCSTHFATASRPTSPSSPPPSRSPRSTSTHRHGLIQ